MMTKSEIHPFIPTLKEQLADRQIDRREFLRTATLLGLSATSAYAMAGVIGGEGAVQRAAAAEAPQRGGTLRCSMRVQEMTDPATFDWIRKSNVARQFLEYVTITGPDNVTRPYLAERWEVSDDLKTWTFTLRKGIKWTNGDPLTSDHIIFNVERWLDPAVGSSMLGLLDSMVTTPSDGNATMTPGAIEKVDDLTFRLHLNSPELAIPEYFYHYPGAIMHPDSIVDGVADISKRPIGTGPFLLKDFTVGDTAVLERNPDYWGGPGEFAGGPYLDKIVYIDLGDDRTAHVAALASDQVDLLFEINIEQFDLVEQLPKVQVFETVTSQTAIARMQQDKEPFTNQHLRNAIQACIDHDKMLEIVYRGRGAIAEDFHCAPIQPEYAPLPKRKQDYDLAQSLLKEAGYENGIELSLDVNNNEAWEVSAAQVMVGMLAPAGIKLKLNVMPGAQYWEIWDKTPFGLTSWTHRPLAIMVYNLAYASGAPWNESHFNNAEFDRILGDANATPDAVARREHMAKLEAILRDSGVMVQPLWRSVFTAGSDRLKGFVYHPTQYHQLFNVWMA
jgi:peptide/nickel transport system substrate-binding protein